MRGRALSLETPSLPFTGTSEATRLSSEMAAMRAGTKAETTRGLVYEFIKQRGSAGATDKEIQYALRMDGSTQRPRRIELRNAGLIEGVPNYTRDGSNVWRVKCPTR